MEEIEVFKDIPGYEGYYQVSDLGRVKRNDGKALKPQLSNGGTNRVTLCKNGCAVRFYVRYLVAMAFLGYNKEDADVVNCIDRDGLNNNLKNLYVSRLRFSNFGTSKYKGVYWDKHARKWCAAIMKDGLRMHLGYFETEEEAHKSYLLVKNS